MTDPEIREILDQADAQGLAVMDRARFILGSGVTLEEYRRFEMRRTARLLLACLIVTVVWCAACDWVVRTYAPKVAMEHRAK